MVTIDEAFSPNEALSRHQFHRVFATNLFYTCDASAAIHETPWTADILSDILLHVYDRNVLIPSDIEAILQVGGFYNHNRELWFTCSREHKPPDTLIAAAAPYLSAREYARLKMGDKILPNSATQFVFAVCVNTQLKHKVARAKLFQTYQDWCYLVGKSPLTRKALVAAMTSAGFRPFKGYLEGKSGIDYWEVALNMDEEVWNAKEQKAPKAQKEEIQQGLSLHGCGGDNAASDVGGGPDALSLQSGIWPDPNSSAVELLHDVAEPTQKYNPWVVDAQVTGSHCGGSDDEGTGPDPLLVIDRDGEAIGYLASPSDVYSIGRDNTYDPPDGGVHAAEGEPVGDPAKTKFKALPKNIRNFMKLMKATYLINPENFGKSDFVDGYLQAGLPFMNELEILEMYSIFQTYAEE